MIYIIVLILTLVQYTVTMTCSINTDTLIQYTAKIAHAVLILPFKHVKYSFLIYVYITSRAEQFCWPLSC